MAPNNHLVYSSDSWAIDSKREAPLLQPQSEEGLMPLWAIIYVPQQLSTCLSPNPSPLAPLPHLVSHSFRYAPLPRLDSPSHTGSGRVLRGKGKVARGAALLEGHLSWALIHSLG